MQLRYLEYFVQAVECKSLNRAARKLDVSPQALCAGVAALEKKLGYALLERSPMGVRPTKNGEIVFQDARDIRDVIHKWLQLSHHQPEKDTVMVKLGASTTLMRWLVPQVVLQVKELYPHIYFNLFESFVEQVFHTVVDQRMLGLITCVNERVESTYRVRLAQNDMTFMEGPEDGCAVIINKSHPFAALSTLTLRDLAELRLASIPSATSISSTATSASTLLLQASSTFPNRKICSGSFPWIFPPPPFCRAVFCGLPEDGRRRYAPRTWWISPCRAASGSSIPETCAPRKSSCRKA